MNIRRALIIGMVNWIIGVSVYSLSIYLPILSNPQVQGNICLSIVLAMLGWYGTRFYYKNMNQTHGIVPAMCMISVAISLDALITVPIMVIPAGGNYGQFFGDLFFWLLMVEYLLVVMLYWWTKVKSLKASI